MTTVFEYEHDIPQTVEFVNGSYQLIGIKTRSILGRDILYCLGEALLDNSCCAATSLAYALVIGEVVAYESRRTEGQRIVSLVKTVGGEAREERICAALLGLEAVSAVNFYTPPETRRARPSQASPR